MELLPDVPKITPLETLSGVWREAKLFYSTLVSERKLPMHLVDLPEFEKKLNAFEAAVPIRLDFPLKKTRAEVLALKHDGQAYCRCVNELRAKGIPSQQDDTTRRGLLGKMEDRLDSILTAMANNLLEILPPLVDEWFARRDHFLVGTQDRAKPSDEEFLFPKDLLSFQVEPSVMRKPSFSSLRRVFPYERLGSQRDLKQLLDALLPFHVEKIRDREPFNFEKLSQDVKFFILQQLDMYTLISLPLVSKYFLVQSELVLERRMFSHVTPRSMLSEWRLVRRAGLSELEVFRTYSRNHNLCKIFMDGITENTSLRYDAKDMHASVEHEIQYLSRIQQSWVTKLIAEISKWKNALEELRHEVKAYVPDGADHPSLRETISPVSQSKILKNAKHLNVAKGDIFLNTSNATGNNSFDDLWRSELTRYTACLDEWTTYSNDVFTEAKDRLEPVLDANVQLKQILDRDTSIFNEAVSCKDAWKLLIKMIQSLFSHYSAWKDAIESLLHVEIKPTPITPSDGEASKYLLLIAALRSQFQELQSNGGPCYTECVHHDCKQRMSFLEQLTRLQGELIGSISGNETRAATWRRLHGKWEDIHKSFPYPDWLDPRCGLSEMALPLLHQHFQIPLGHSTGNQLSNLRKKMADARRLLVSPIPPLNPPHYHGDDLVSLMADMAPSPDQRNYYHRENDFDDIDALLADLGPTDPNSCPSIDDLLADLL